MMSQGGLSGMMAFLVAYLAGLGAGWVALGTVVTAFFRGPDTALPLLLIAVLPIVGIAAFQLVYTLITRRRLTSRFWAGAAALVYGAAMLSLVAVKLLPGQGLVALAVFVTVTAGTGMRLLAPSDPAKGGRP